jgi:hypothetical protein
MKTAEELRKQFKDETNFMFAFGNPAYTDWLEKKLVSQSTLNRDKVMEVLDKFIYDMLSKDPKRNKEDAYNALCSLSLPTLSEEDRIEQYPIVCPSCLGSGYVSCSEFNPNVTGSAMNMICPACNGGKTVIVTRNY